MTKPLAALVALAGFLHAGSAIAATAGTFLLFPPSEAVAPPPPLAPGTSAPQTATDLKIPGHVASHELVEVGIGPDGTPVRVTATQRLRLDGTGDYSFIVPAPATSVIQGEGSESSPGLRDVGLIWQGFSNGHRVLSAKVTLRAADAAGGLPLQVRFERRGGSTVVRLVNRARRQVFIATAGTERAATVEALEKLRAGARMSGTLGGLWYVRGAPRKGKRVDVSAPLRVSGVISQGSSRVPVDGVLGGARSLERAFVLPGATAPTLRLSVELLPPIEILPTVAELAQVPHPLLTLQAALGEIATSRAYRRFLDTPDPVGASEASYVYRSVPKAAAAAAPARRRDESHTLAIVLAAALGASGLAGLAVLWARS